MSEVIKPKFREYQRHLLVCTGPRCTLNGEGQALFDSLQGKLKAAELGVDAGPLCVKRTRTGCVAACKGGPILGVQPDGTWYYNVTEENMDRIIVQHLQNGRIVEDLVFHQGPSSTCVFGPTAVRRGCQPAVAGQTATGVRASQEARVKRERGARSMRSQCPGCPRNGKRVRVCHEATG